MPYRILVVEDDPTLRRELVTLLECSCTVKYHKKIMSN